MTCSGKTSTTTTTTDLTGLTTLIDQLVDAKLNAKLGVIAAKIAELEALASKAQAAITIAESSAMAALDAKNHCTQMVQQCTQISQLMSEKIADGFNKNGSFEIAGKTYHFKHGIIVRVEV